MDVKAEKKEKKGGNTVNLVEERESDSASHVCSTAPRRTSLRRLHEIELVGEHRELIQHLLQLIGFTSVRV